MDLFYWKAYLLYPTNEGVDYLLARDPAILEHVDQVRRRGGQYLLLEFIFR